MALLKRLRDHNGAGASEAARHRGRRVTRGGSILRVNEQLLDTSSDEEEHDCNVRSTSNRMSTSSEEEAVVARSRKQDTASESSEEEQKLVEEGQTQTQVYAASDDSDNGEFTGTEISEIPVVTSFTQLRQEARFRALNRMYIEAKVVFIEEQTLHSGKKVVQLHCWGVLKKASIATCVEIQEFMRARSEEPETDILEKRSIFYKKSMRVSIWNSPLQRVKQKIRVLDVIRIIRFTRLHLFNNWTPQLNVSSLEHIKVRQDQHPRE